jgi:hypothetical protein
MDPKEHVEEDAAAWEEAAVMLTAVAGMPVASSPAAVAMVSPTENASKPRTASVASHEEPPIQDTKHVSWGPGMVFRKIKSKLEETEVIKKLKEHEVVRKITENNAAVKIFGEISPRKLPSEPASEEPRTVAQGLFGLNHPIYNKAMDWKNKNRDESQKRTLDTHRRYSETEVQAQHSFATVTVSDVVLENMPNWAKRSPYVVFCVEGKTQTTTRAPSKGPYSWPVWQGAWEVSDVWSDLSITVFSAKAGSEVVAMEDEYVSKGFLPLSAVMNHAKQPFARTLFRSEDTVFHLRVDVHLLQVTPQTRTYASCVQGLPSSGLQRPTEPTGRVRLTIRIRMNAPLIKALALVPPSRRSILPPKDETLNPVLLQQRKMRLKTILAQYGAAFELLVEGILSWRHPFATWIWLTIFTQVTLFSEPYNLPFMTALTAVLGAYFVHVQKQAIGERPPPILFMDETTLDPEIPQTIPAKVRALQKLASGFQIVLGTVATLLERIYFALSWDDPLLSFVVSIALLGLGLVASLIFAVIYEYSQVFRAALFLAGVSLHVPSSYQQLARTQIAATLKRLRSPSADNPEIEKGFNLIARTLHREQSVEEMLNEHDDADAHRIVEATLTHALPSREDMRSGLKNIFGRIPDGIEIDHRAIAKARYNVVED